MNVVVRQLEALFLWKKAKNRMGKKHAATLECNALGKCRLETYILRTRLRCHFLSVAQVAEHRQS